MDRVMGGWTDGLYDGRVGMTDGLSVGWMDSATDLGGDRQIGGGGVGERTDWSYDRLTWRRTDGSCDRRTDVRVGEMGLGGPAKLHIHF